MVRGAQLAGRYRQAVPRRAQAGVSSRLTTPGAKSEHLAGTLRQTDSRPRIALLQSLVGVNQDHVRMITGMRSTYLSRCPHRLPRSSGAQGPGRPHGRQAQRHFRG
jgi:hypothetical protein